VEADVTIIDQILASPHGLTVAVHLFVTDVDTMLPLRGDPLVKRGANYEVDIAAARRERLIAVLTAFCERANKNRPPFADDRALDYVRRIIDLMISHGLLSHRHRAEMLGGVRLSKDGGVTGEVVGMFAALEAS
jgi:hypothetical protein